VELIRDRGQALSDEQRETFDWVVASRGQMIPPFQVLLHSPGIAREVAELGAKVRFESSLSDHDRELVIITAARIHSCAFEWESHLPLAREAGVREEAIAAIEAGDSSALTETEELLTGFVRELCAESTVGAERFQSAHRYLGEVGVVELCATIGYYTLLAMVIGACDACD
jgi:4-carboxymuconolactone decarboxylase